MTVAVDLLRDGLIRVRDDGGLGRAPVTEPGPPAEPPASDLGACAICHDRAASSRCVNCLRAVCRDDHWVMFGLCRGCLTDEEMRRAREHRLPSRPDLGIKWVED